MGRIVMTRVRLQVIYRYRNGGCLSGGGEAPGASEIIERISPEQKITFPYPGKDPCPVHDGEKRNNRFSSGQGVFFHARYHKKNINEPEPNFLPEGNLTALFSCTVAFADAVS